MRRTVLRLVVCLVAAQLLAGCGGENHPVASDPYSPPTGGPSASTSAAPYAWVDAEDAIGEGYTVAFVKGMTVPQVLRALGTVEERAGDHGLDRLQELPPDGDSLGPPTLWVDEAPGGVLVFSIWASLAYDRVSTLSRSGAAAAFTTSIDADTYLSVARRGRVVRELDTFLGSSLKGRALPEEKGLGFGGEERMYSGPWELLERITGVHVSSDWFFESHPTYVFAED